MFIQIQELKLTSWWCFPTTTCDEPKWTSQYYILFYSKNKNILRLVDDYNMMKPGTILALEQLQNDSLPKDPEGWSWII